MMTPYALPQDAYARPGEPRERTPTIAFLLAFVPGLGHLYLARWFRALLYGGGALFPFAAFALVTLLARDFRMELLLLAFAGSFFVWFVNMVDMALTLQLRRSRAANETAAPYGFGAKERTSAGGERALAIGLSLLPGLGHVYVGRTPRGVALLLGALAALVGPFALALALREPVVLLGWIAAPMLVAFAMTDAAALLERRERGEPIAIDPTIDPWFAPWPNGKRPIVAAALSAAPGLGHLYAGATARGMQLLGTFLLLLFLIDATRLSMIHYALPMLWAYAFFDALRGGAGAAPTGSARMNRWMGVALMGIGAYALLNDVLLQAFAVWFPEWPWHRWTQLWFEPMLGAAALIGFGWLLWNGRNDNGE